MDLGILGLMSGLLVAVVPSVFLYRSTRQRDAPTIEIARQNADVASARAVAELWAEYVAQVKRDMEQTYARLELLEARAQVAEKGLADCLAASKRNRRAPHV